MKSISKLPVFRKLSRVESLGDIILFIQIITLWCLLPLFLLFTLKRVLRVLTPKKNSLPKKSTDSPKKQKIIRFVNYWCSRPLIAAQNSCLKKSLLLYYFLNRHGFPVRIYIGIKKEHDELLVPLQD